jgi:hypothetical protein
MWQHPVHPVDPAEASCGSIRFRPVLVARPMTASRRPAHDAIALAGAFD